MKVNFNRAALAEALGLLTSVVPSRTPKPILRCVQITAEGKEVRVCATDLEVGINYLISEVQVEKPGEVIVVGYDVTPQTAEEIKKGYVSFVNDQQPYLQGYYTVVQLAMMKYGKFAAFGIDTGRGIVNASNVDEVLELVKERIR